MELNKQILGKNIGLDVVIIGKGSSGKRQKEFGGTVYVEAKQKRETISSFMRNAREGDVYKTGPSFGSPPETFRIVSYRRSPNRPGIKSGNRQPIALSRVNVEKYLVNGATRIASKRGRKSRLSLF